jgi:phenylacetate-CoA ligase
VDEGEMGIAVVTPLGRRSFPLIRFNTNDVVRKGKGDCACGRTSMMIQGMAGRADDLRKIRGVLFTPVSVEEVLRAEFPEITEYQITVQKRGIMDEISLKVEPREEMGESDMKELLSRISERLKMKTNLRFVMVPVTPGTLPRYTLKSKRFKDRREIQGGAAS